MSTAVSAAAAAAVAGDQLYYNPPATSASALAPDQTTIPGADPYVTGFGLKQDQQVQQVHVYQQHFQQQAMAGADAELFQQRLRGFDSNSHQLAGNRNLGGADYTSPTVPMDSPSLKTVLVDDSAGAGSRTPGAATLDGGDAPLDLRRQLCDQNLFIFHLPSEWREAEIREAFSPFGNIISAKVVKRPDGSSKGYGFVCYENREFAVMAMEQMNGYSVAGKRLKVSLKKTPEECLNMQVQKLLRMSQQNEYYDRDRDCSLFVFHLPPHWDDEDLREEFEPFGPVVAAKVSRKEDGTSRGYGFVTCPDPRSAALAILHLNGLEVCNKRLKVQPKQLSGATHPRPDCTVFVFHLPNDWTDSVLKQFFNHCGRVVSATVQRDPRGRSRGFGFVTFDRQQSARDAVAELNGVSVGVKRLKVSLKRTTAQDADGSPGGESNTVGSPVGGYTPPMRSPNRYDSAYRGGGASPRGQQGGVVWDGQGPRQGAWLTQSRPANQSSGGMSHQAAIVRDSAFAGVGFLGVAAAMAARGSAATNSHHLYNQQTAAANGVSPPYGTKLVDHSGQSGKGQMAMYADGYGAAGAANVTANAATNSRREDYLLQQQQQFYGGHMMLSPLLAQQQNRNMMMVPTNSTSLVAATNPYAAAQQQASYQMAAARGSTGGSPGLQQWGAAAAATVPYTATHPSLAAQQRNGLQGITQPMGQQTQLSEVDRI